MKIYARVLLVSLTIFAAILARVYLGSSSPFLDIGLVGYALGLLASIISKPRRDGDWLLTTNKWDSLGIPRSALILILVILIIISIVGIPATIYNAGKKGIDTISILQIREFYVAVVCILLLIEHMRSIRIYERGFIKGFRFIRWDDVDIEYTEDKWNKVQLKYTPGILFKESIVLQGDLAETVDAIYSSYCRQALVATTRDTD